jgi:hypothetical protein
MARSRSVPGGRIGPANITASASSATRVAAASGAVVRMNHATVHAAAAWKRTVAATAAVCGIVPSRTNAATTT